MKGRLLALFFGLHIFATQVMARANFVLKAQVPSSVRTRVDQIELNSSKSLVTFSGQSNSQHWQEQQKFEVESYQSGLVGKVKRYNENGRVIQYELIIDHVSNRRPIYLKISAN